MKYQYDVNELPNFATRRKGKIMAEDTKVVYQMLVEKRKNCMIEYDTEEKAKQRMRNIRTTILRNHMDVEVYSVDNVAYFINPTICKESDEE